MGLINVPAWQIKFPIKFPIHTPCSSKPFATLLSHCPIHLGRTFCAPHFFLMTRQLRSDYRTKSMSHLVQSCQMHPLAFVHTHKPPDKTLTPSTQNSVDISPWILLATANKPLASTNTALHQSIIPFALKESNLQELSEVSLWPFLKVILHSCITRTCLQAVINTGKQVKSLIPS